MNLRPSKFYEPLANHVASFATASWGKALRFPTPSSQVERFSISRALNFIQVLVGIETLIFSRGCIFSGPTPEGMYFILVFGSKHQHQVISAIDFTVVFVERVRF